MGKRAMLWMADDIRALRVGLGWSQTRLAAYLKATQPQVSSWEQGKFCPSQAYQAALTLLVRKYEGGALAEVAGKIRARRLERKRSVDQDQAEQDEIFAFYQQVQARRKETI